MKGSTIVLPVAGITKVVLQSISYAKSLSDNVVAVYVGFDEEEIQRLEKKWEEVNPAFAGSSSAPATAASSAARPLPSKRWNGRHRRVIILRYSFLNSLRPALVA